MGGQLGKSNPLAEVGIKETTMKACKEKKDTKRTYKVLIVGHTEAGKTTLRDVMTCKEFKDKQERTFGSEGIHLEFSFRDENFHLCLYDTPGVEKHEGIVLTYLADTDCLILAYEAYHEGNFTETVDKWLPYFMKRDEAKSIKQVFILGNKGDERKGKSTDWGINFDPSKLKEEYKVKIAFNQCSSKTGENIQEFFWTMVEELAKHNPARHTKHQSRAGNL